MHFAQIPQETPRAYYGTHHGLVRAFFYYFFLSNTFCPLFALRSWRRVTKLTEVVDILTVFPQTENWGPTYPGYRVRGENRISQSQTGEMDQRKLVGPRRNTMGSVFSMDLKMDSPEKRNVDVMPSGFWCAARDSACGWCLPSKSRMVAVCCTDNFYFLGESYRIWIMVSPVANDIKIFYSFWFAIYLLWRLKSLKNIPTFFPYYMPKLAKNNLFGNNCWRDSDY